MTALAAAALAVAGCTGGGGRPSLVVSAAASLKKPFTRYASQFSAATIRYSFAGSDVLAAQIEQGATPDVFASANTALPQLLYTRHLAAKPVVFAANRLVLAVPASSAIRTLLAVERHGVKLVVGTATVPVGAYTEAVLSRMSAPDRRAVLANVADREPDVSGIVGKLTEGAADAGFLYQSDVAGARGLLRAIPLPSSLQPRISYGVTIINGAQHRAQAQAFVAGLLRGRGRGDLLAAGFLAPAG